MAESIINIFNKHGVEVVRRGRDGEYLSKCPWHDDSTASLSINESKGVFHCFGCGAEGGIKDVLERFGERLHGCAVAGGGNTHTPSGVTLETYAEKKRLDKTFLASLGLSTQRLGESRAVRIPYFDEAGIEIGVRYRVSSQGKEKVISKKGGKAAIYGLWQLSEFRKNGFIILVEGESDTQTLWSYCIPALGVPGAATWKKDWSQYLVGLSVFVWQEPDAGGNTFIDKVGESLPDILVITPPEGVKDISEAHIRGDDIPVLIEKLKKEAVPYSEILKQKISKETAEAKEKAASILACGDVLAKFETDIALAGLVGEEKNAKLLFCALTSRLLSRPVSFIIKGPSSAGKSHVIEKVLQFFPVPTYYALSSMSDHSLAYGEEPLSHRMLVIYEYAGINSDFASYLVRSLLSEGHIRYETVEKTDEGLKSRLIERAGPTGLIVSTTAVRIHPENETRLFSITVNDATDQTVAILGDLANRINGNKPGSIDFEPWHSFQTWLELAGCREVSIPYAHELAAGCDARAIRLRRDFTGVLNLIAVHCILNQAYREKTVDDRLIATLADYEAVYSLINDVISEGVAAAVSPTVREIVQTVSELYKFTGETVTVKTLAEHLKIDKSAASRRVSRALRDDYLINDQEKKYQPMKLRPGDPLPEDSSILPTPEILARCVDVLSPPSTVQPCNRSESQAEQAERIFIKEPNDKVMQAVMQKIKGGR